MRDECRWSAYAAYCGVYHGYDRYCNRLHHSHLLTATPEAVWRVKGDLRPATLTNLRQGLVNRRVWLSLTGSEDGDYDWRPLARQVQAPTLVLHGDQDPCRSPAARSGFKRFPTHGSLW